MWSFHISLAKSFWGKKKRSWIVGYLERSGSLLAVRGNHGDRVRIRSLVSFLLESLVAWKDRDGRPPAGKVHVKPLRLVRPDEMINFWRCPPPPTCNHRMEKPRSAFGLPWITCLWERWPNVSVNLSCPFSQADWCCHAHPGWLTSFPGAGLDSFFFFSILGVYFFFV